MNDFKQMLNESMKVKIYEEDAFKDAPEVVELPVEETPTENVPAEVEEPIASEKPEVTDELVAELSEANTEIKDVNQAEFKAGLEVELEHLETVGGDVNIIAKIVLDHIKEFPGKDYYAALNTMEAGLKEEAANVEQTEEEVVEPEVTEDPVENEVTEEPSEEPVVEESKKDKKALSQTKNEN